MKNVLISGASFAGLSTAYWMNKLGYQVTVIEVAPDLKKGGTPVNILENTIDTVKRMGLFDQIMANKIDMTLMEFKNADDVTERSDTMQRENEYEIERDVLLNILFDAVKVDIDLVFGNSITGLNQTEAGMEVHFRDGEPKIFDLVFGCDGIHSAVRKIWFGHEAEYAQFLGTYFSITIVEKLLIPEHTTQMYSEPGKTIMLNAYNGKTDIILCFSSETEIPYDYRNEEQIRNIILEQFEKVGWRTPELLQEMMISQTFYFDKFCQVKMPSWTKGRVALVGDAGYCASPAAGRGGSLALDGAAALADAIQKYSDHRSAFQEYNTSFRPFIEEIQAGVVEYGLDALIPKTEEAIRKRNREGFGF